MPRNTSNLSRFQWKLDLEHLIKVNLPFRARELVISDIHPFSDRLVALFGAIVVQPGVRAGHGRCGKLLHIVITTERHFALERDKGLAFQGT